MEAADISHHTSRRLTRIWNVYAARCWRWGARRDQLTRSLMSLVDADSSLGRAVARDDYKVNGMEVSIDEDCSRILATRSPRPATCA